MFKQIEIFNALQAISIKNDIEMNFHWLSLLLKLLSLVPDKLVYKDVAMEDAFVSIQGILIDNIIFLK